MEYVRPKLQMFHYKKDPPHVLYRKLAHDANQETLLKMNFSLGCDLSLWIVRLMSLNSKYSFGAHRFFEGAAVGSLIKDYLQIVSGNKF